MDANIKEKLNQYLDWLDDLKQKTASEAVALSLVQELAKDQRTLEIRQEREAKGSEQATDKQKKFLKKLGLKYPRNLTKQEASAMIDEELGKAAE